MTNQTQPEALPEPAAWVIDLECDMRGFLDAKAWPEDEFTTPLYTADHMRAYAIEHAAKLHAECEALREALQLFFDDKHDDDGEWAVLHIQSEDLAKARAALARNKEQSNG